MPYNSAERIPLTRIPRELASLTGQTPPAYRKLYVMTLDGRLPDVEQDKNGRYGASRASLQRIAYAVGMTTVKPKWHSRRQASPSNVGAAA